MIFDLLIPRDPASPPEKMPRGAAILATRRGGRSRYAVAAPQRARQPFADVCRLAARRGRVIELDAEELVQIGHWDEGVGEARLLPGRDRALAAWLGHYPHRNDIEASDSLANERMQARQDARRAMMRGDVHGAMRIAGRHGFSGF